MNSLTAQDIQGQVAYWLRTPVNSILGSDFGNNINDLLQKPQSTILANAVVKKLKEDIPVLQALPSGSVNIYSKKNQYDKLEFFIDIAGSTFTIES